jgi:hypothetical protein
MATWQFDARINPDHTLSIPPEVADQLTGDTTVHVVLLAGDPNEDADWQRLATQQFFNGYAASDAIYDELPAG